MKELVEIQNKLKAPKNQINNFGKYNYRSCEDILEAVKPLAHENGCVVLLSDEVKIIGERVYVVSTAILKSENVEISSTAYAREPLSQKGMNEAQITGSASSYARKYALNGLFAIDDTKDADSQDNTVKVVNNKEKLTDEKFKKALGFDNEQIKAVISKFDLDDSQLKQLNEKIK